MKRNTDIHRGPLVRSSIVCVILLGLMALAVNSIINVSSDAEYVAAAIGQSIYRLDVAKSRGTIYDCHLQPLTSGKGRWIAAVPPTIETIGALETATGGQYRQQLALHLEDGKPFAMEIDQPLENDLVDMFRVQERYSQDQLAPHVVGYLDSMGGGAAGVELCMNDALDRHSGEIRIYYQVDALGRVIAGAGRQIVDNMENTAGGVAVTIDSELQRLAEKAAQRLGRGAVVITQAPNCEIRAMVSMPDFDPNDIATAANASKEDAPLVNRALCGYAPGSVFKLVTAAAMLESGAQLKEFDCTGSINAGGMLFKCYDGQPHGKLTLKSAIEKSCNCYFISAARALGGQPALSMAYNLGFGTEQEFGRGLFSDQGTLPKAQSLENSRALANFSFGQGDLTVTPLQVCGMMNAIVCDGVYSSPKLIQGLVSAEGELVPQQAISDVSLQAMSKKTAALLGEYLISAAKVGTGAKGAPEDGVCGIKTGTAQTGVYENGVELSHFWYSGFVCDKEGNKYCITVLREGVADDGGVTASVFKEISQGLVE